MKKKKLNKKEKDFIKDYTKRAFERSDVESSAYVDFVNVFKKHFPFTKKKIRGKMYDVTDPHLVADVSLAKALYWYLGGRNSDYEAFPLFLEWLTQSYMTLVLEDNVQEILFVMDWMKQHKHTSERTKFDYNDLDNFCYYLESSDISKGGVSHLRRCLMMRSQNTKTAVVFEYWNNTPQSLYFYRLKYGESDFWLTKQKDFLKSFRQEEFMWGSSMKLDFDCYDLLPSPPLFKRIEGQDFNFIKHVVFEINSLKTEIDLLDNKSNKK